MNITISARELESWCSRKDIVIYAMDILPSGHYRLFYSEKPLPHPDVLLEEELGAEAAESDIQAKNAPQGQPEAKNEPIVCLNCGVVIEGEECPICAGLTRALKEAKVNRREYYFKKQAERGARLPYKEEN